MSSLIVRHRRCVMTSAPQVKRCPVTTCTLEKLVFKDKQVGFEIKG
jgi:hypothetical protein